MPHFRKILSSFWVVCIYLLDTALLFIPRNKRCAQKKNVLIIRLDAIGDFVLWLDAAKELRKLYPENQYKFTLLANVTWALLAGELPCFDEVWPVKRARFNKNLYYRWKVLSKIRHDCFDVALQPTFSREFCYGDSVIRLSGAKEKIGSRGDYSNISKWQKCISDHWYTRLLLAKEEPMMELQRNAEFLHGLGMSDFKAAMPHILISNQSRITKADYFVIFPGALYQYRCWDINHYRKLSSRLYLKTGWHVVICGGIGEEHLGDALTFDADFPFINRIGATTIVELAEIIGGARVVLANETSAIHIAAAVSTPSICILGGGHFGRFMPYNVKLETGIPLPLAVFHRMDCFGCNWQCIYDVPPGQPKPCIANISVEDVWEEIEKKL